jgi:hypothetical protein
MAGTSDDAHSGGATERPARRKRNHSQRFSEGALSCISPNGEFGELMARDSKGPPHQAKHFQPEDHPRGASGGRTARPRAKARAIPIAASAVPQAAPQHPHSFSGSVGSRGIFAAE